MSQLRWLPTSSPFEERPFRRVFERVRRSLPPDPEIVTAYTDGQVTWRSNRSKEGYHEAADLSGFQGVDVGDFVVHGLDILRGSIGVADSTGALSSVCIVCVPRVESDPRFFAYAMRAQAWAGVPRALAKGVREGGADFRRWETLADLPLPVPSPAEQRAIADHLDAETARIDALISKKRRLIELLDERWYAWVRHELNSLKCPLLPLKRRWRVIDCKHRTPTYTDHGYPVVSPGDTTPGRLDLSRAHRFVDEVDYRDLAAGARRPRAGDIVYSRNASIGIASYVDTDEPFCMGQDVCLIRSDDMDQLFLMYVLNSIGIDQLEVQKIGSTFSRVNISQILEIEVPVPDQCEQHALARRLDVVASRQSQACRILDKQIGLLQERRQAVITAIVTGETPVRPVAEYTR